MPRQARVAPGGLVYHVLNRAVARLPLLQKREDYTAFEDVLTEAWQRHPIRLLAYCLMPNHWHMVLWPREDGELTAFVRWLTHPHPALAHPLSYHRDRPSLPGAFQVLPRPERRALSDRLPLRRTPCEPTWPSGLRTGDGPASGGVIAA